MKDLVKGTIDSLSCMRDSSIYLDKINFFWKRDKDRSMGEGTNWETLVMERLSDRCVKEEWGIYQIVGLRFIEKSLLINQKY